MASKNTFDNGETIVIYGDDDNKNHQTSHDKSVEDLYNELREVGSSATVRVYKCNLGSKNADSFCDSFPADKYDLPSLYQYIKHKFGGGDYRLLMYKAGHKGVYENKLISISNEMSLPTPTNGGDGDFKMMMLEYFRRSDERFMQFLESQQKPPVDPHADMMKNLNMIKQMNEAFNPNGAQVLQKPVDPMESLTKLISTIVSLKSVGGQLSGLFGGENSGGGDDSLIGLAREFAPQIKQVIDMTKREQDLKINKTTLAGAAQLPKIPAPNNAPNVPNARNVERVRRTPAPAQENAPALSAEFKGAFDTLQKCAENDLDTAGVLDSFLTPELIPKIKPYLDVEKPFRKLAALYPPILDYPEWWAEFINEAKNRLTQMA